MTQTHKGSSYTVCFHIKKKKEKARVNKPYTVLSSAEIRKIFCSHLSTLQTPSQNKTTTKSSYPS